MYPDICHARLAGWALVAGDEEGKGLPVPPAPGLVLRRHDAVAGRRVQAVGEDLHLVAEVDLTHIKG